MDKTALGVIHYLTQSTHQMCESTEEMYRASGSEAVRSAACTTLLSNLRLIQLLWPKDAPRDTLTEALGVASDPERCMNACLTDMLEEVRESVDDYFQGLGMDPGSISLGEA